MGKRIIGCLATIGVGLILLVCCVSSTIFDERFRESLALPAPTFNISVVDDNQFSFCVVADLHIANSDTARYRRILAAATAEGDSFCILPGDMVDHGETVDFVAMQTAQAELGWANKVAWVIGNHDVFGSGWSSFKTYFGPGTYRFNVGNSSFTVLDTGDGTVGESQTEWLEAEMAKPKPTNTFIVSHYLPVIPGITTYLKLANDREALRLMKLAKNNGVRAWIGGHYHSFVTGNIEGVDYVVTGGGGGRRMEPVKTFFYVQVQVNGANVSYTYKTVE